MRTLSSNFQAVRKRPVLVESAALKIYICAAANEHEVDFQEKRETVLELKGYF